MTQVTQKLTANSPKSMIYNDFLLVSILLQAKLIVQRICILAKIEYFRCKMALNLTFKEAANSVS